jgi:O-antigen/teichoic acid export membrane protein
MVGWLFGLSLLTYVDRVFLESLIGSSAVGIYSSNYAIVQSGLPLILSPIIQAAHPVIMKEWNTGNEGSAIELISEYSRYFLLIGAPATVVAGILSRPLSVLFLGEGFHPGYLIIPIISVAVFIWNFAMIGHKGLELHRVTKLMTAGIAIAVGVNAVFNLLLIPVFSYIGAAVATLLSSGAYAAFAYVMSFRTVRWRLPLNTTINVTSASTIMALIGLVCYLLSDWILVPLLGSGIAALMYGAILIILGELRSEEISRLRSLMNLQ